jgi:SagB-type dehydrogenase family enzyme
MLSREEQRAVLRADGWSEWEKVATDQKTGIHAPPIQKPYPEDVTLIDLTAPDEFTVGQMPLVQAMARRRSRRQYTQEPLNLEELSFLLWATQGTQSPVPSGIDPSQPVASVRRIVPSAGARHPFETYLYVRRVTNLEPGIYRYLALHHKLYYQHPIPASAEGEERLWRQQGFLSAAAVVFIWTALPYRTEWRYDFLSPKLIAQDSGHLCQNLYLAVESIGAGTCAVDSYDQKGVDQLVGVDGEEEFAIYLAPVGKIPAEP